MAISVTICNLALGDIRETPIADIGEATNPAKLCQRYYPHCLSLLLADHPWSFATKIVTLPALLTNEREGQWGFAYGLPTDLGQVLRIHSSGELGATGVRARTLDYWPYPISYLIPEAWGTFVVEAGKLYANVSDAAIEYTANDIDEAAMSPLFREALRKLLAANLAVPIRDSAEMEVKLLKEAEMARQKAIAADSNRAPQPHIADEVAWVRG